ncbi:hypothetical protein BJ508DRAFT_320858 [Ascobolus immersus RN42]|uniref:Signal recognition particle receptor subunit beta n=1 Tax=Ascobolus immersus RN42 TaxID=1160509 RepID=A0A3N4INX6_ASCIM|nr:hypothetical protein BJ508DRAFT_320858 [Ascobolus immersus RN42]
MSESTPKGSEWAEWFTLLLSANRTAVIASVATVFLVPVLLHFLITVLFPERKHLNPTIIALGPSNAGKTCLMAQIELNYTTPTNKVPVETRPSIESWRAAQKIPKEIPEDGEHIVESNDHAWIKFDTLDNPGWPEQQAAAIRQLQGLLEERTGTLSGVMFVVDSSKFSGKDEEALNVVDDSVAFLYDVLLELQRSFEEGKRTKPYRVLICSNKEDLFTATPAKKVSEKLEKGVCQTREDKARGPLKAGQEEGDEIYTLIPGGPDGWKWLEEVGIDVQVKGGNLFGVKKGSTEWMNWIRECFV